VDKFLKALNNVASGQFRVFAKIVQFDRLANGVEKLKERVSRWMEWGRCWRDG
jgi:hypothetical protein